MQDNNQPTSFTLLQRVRNRDEEAWERLVVLYGPLVKKWCSSQKIQGADLDDVCQEVFRAVANSLDTFRSHEANSSFRGWLRGIASHKLIDHFRKAQKQPRGQGGTDAHQGLQQVAQPEFPEDSEHDLTSLYHRALDMVKGEFEARTWDAFWRVAVEGQLPALVADEMGVTPAAIRKAKSRVLFRLRQELGDVLE